MIEEVKELIEQKNSLVWQLNVLQEKIAINPYDEILKIKMAWLKESIEKVKLKIKTLKMRDFKWED